MGSFWQWLDENLDSPLGQLGLAVFGLLLKLGYDWWKAHQKRIPPDPRPSSPKA